MIQRLSLNSQCFGVLLWCILYPPVNSEGKNMFNKMDMLSMAKRFEIYDIDCCLGC